MQLGQLQIHYRLHPLLVQVHSFGANRLQQLAQPNAVVITSATTAGRVQTLAAEAADRHVGIYLRHPGEASGAANPATAAAAGEVIVILLRPGVG